MKKILVLVVLIYATLFSVIEVQSQVTSCGNTEPCSGPWVPLGPTKYEVAPGCWVTVNLEVRNCTGQDEFRYEIVTPFEPLPNNNCSYLNYNTTALKRLINLQAVTFIGSGIPPCTESPARVVKYDEVACTFEKVCTAQAELLTDLDCNDGTTESTAGTTVTYTTRTHLPCGTQCCKIEYDICSKSYTVGGTAQIDRIITNFSKIPITDCTAPPPGTTAAECDGCN